MSAEAGFLKCEKAVSTNVKELTQLDEGAVKGNSSIALICPELLSKEEKERVFLEAVNLIAENETDGKRQNLC